MVPVSYTHLSHHYCQAYRNFEPVGDLTDKEMSLEEVAHDSRALLTGMPASSDQVTGRVRVLLDLADIETIEPGEILVTRYTDTGWSYVFGILGGLVTEYGGVLCHASIVARECEMCIRDSVNAETVEGLVQASVGQIFSRVLEDAGVYKRTEEGQEAFMRFVQSVGIQL